ncbi:MAG: hypothetical protein JO097_17525 [Acidobacteriaceae bacterium]|nr:hypothetical protein [Acidobacteriaceae bacterium]MBV9296992.1 hypothetical protein [Acidobacteriaceae bacterium]MBV9765610.1 hypothetical protein [Acidobacteriaceae bacterium]
MSMHVPEEQLALYVTADVGADESEKIEKHLQICSECRQSLSDFELSQQMFRGFCTQPSQGDLLAIRENVMRRVASRRSSTWHWKWFAGLTTAGIAVLLFLSHPAPVLNPSIRAVPAKTSLLARSKAPALPPIRNVKVAHIARRHTAAGLRSVNLIAQANQPSLIRIATSDPQVVILLQSAETKPEERTENNE